MLYGFILIIHVIVSLLLVAVILLQAGKGGGLSEVFGGGSAQSVFGTRAGDFLGKMTTIIAITFMVTSLLLVFISSRFISGSVVDRYAKMAEKLRAHTAARPHKAAKVASKTKKVESKAGFALPKAKAKSIGGGKSKSK